MDRLLLGSELKTPPQRSKKSDETAAENKKPHPLSPDLSMKNLSSTLEKIKPFLEAFVALCVRVFPYISQFSNASKQLYEDHLEQFYSPELTELVVGVVLLFFGGNFALTIACYAAIRLSGWDTLTNSLKSLWQTYVSSRSAITKELKEELDTDGDGIVSAQEIAHALKDPKHINLLTMTLLKTIDPNELMDAMKGLWLVLVSVMVTVRSQFAQQITIGNNIAAVFQDMMEVYCQEGLEDVLKSYHPTYGKWSNFIIVCLTRVVCISVSLILTKFVAAYHSALKGGDILSKVILRILIENEFVSGNDHDLNNVRVLIMQSFAFYGFYSQMISMFTLAWWLRIALMPIIILENFLYGLSYYTLV